MPPSSQNTRPPPFTTPFFNPPPSVAVLRKVYITTVAKAAFLFIIVILSVLSIYWGSLWKTPQETNKMPAWFVIFDDYPTTGGGSVGIGEAVRRGFEEISGNEAQLGWYEVPASHFPNGPDEVRKGLDEEKCWAAIVVRPNATASLLSAILTLNSTFDPSSSSNPSEQPAGADVPITVFGDEARNENIYPAFVVTSITTGLQASRNIFSDSFPSLLTDTSSLSSAGLSNLISNATNINLGQALTTVPKALSDPMGMELVNLRPFDYPVASAADFVGLIYLLIISFIVALLNFNARVMSGYERTLSLRSLLAVRLIAPFVIYFFISWFYSFVTLAFQVSFSRFHGSGGFIIYWAMNYLGMCALGFAMESMVTLLTPKFIPFFLILWIISNVSVSFYPIEALPNVFRYGYAVPFYNVSRTVKALLFGTRAQFGLNFGVQLAWIALSLCTLTLFTILARRREEQAWRKQQQEQASKPAIDEASTTRDLEASQEKNELSSPSRDHHMERGPDSNNEDARSTRSDIRTAKDVAVDGEGDEDRISKKLEV